MSQSTFTIGYVPCAKSSWADARLDDIRIHGLAILKEAMPDTTVAGGEKLITTDQEAADLTETLAQSQVDVLVVHFTTFALGTIVPMLAKRLKVPVIFWSMPEPPMQGGRLSANSFCAVNMNAHTLWKLGHDYLHVHADIDEVLLMLQGQLKVCACVKRLSQLKLGLVGNRVPGFYTSDANELLLRRELGVEIELITLYELVELSRKIDPTLQQQGLVQLTQSASNNDASQDELDKSAALYQAFMQLKDKYQLDSFAIRCWPEFGDLFGVGVCAVSSMLNDIGILSGCEGDVYGTVTMAIQHALSGNLPFFCDLISIDGENNTGITWHCGAAPQSLCSADTKPQLHKHSIIDGGEKKGVTVEFPLKPGRVTIARLSENQTGDGYRMLITTGTAIQTPQLLRGNPLQIKFDVDLPTLAQTLVYQGFEHHFSVVHGEIGDQLVDLCRVMNIEPIVLN